MSIRGTGIGIEGLSERNGFFMGIVVKNNDPLMRNRVKVYIPELSNQPYDDWFSEFDKIQVKAPGIKTKDEWTDNWKDTDIFEQIAELIPWAEPCYPIFGEGSNYRYYKEKNIKTITDANYVDGFNINETDPISLENGSFAPSFLYETNDLTLGDGFSNPTVSITPQCNPYAFQYKPSNKTNEAKGLFSIPNIGTKVWVFHKAGDTNHPQYFGVIRDERELITINDIEVDDGVRYSQQYPNTFDN